MKRPVNGRRTHDVEALRGLMHGLIVSGFAMQAHGNSRPASGSDHQLSHLWEMERLTVGGKPAAHGACVGVGAVAMLALYEWLLARDVAAAARARVQTRAWIGNSRRAVYVRRVLVAGSLGGH